MRSLLRMALSVALTIAGTAGTSLAAAADGTDRKPTVLITGSNRGIGLEFARQYADKGWRVIATARDPAKAEDLKALAARNPNVTLEALDVADNGQIDALAAKYKGQPIDVLLNNAGWLGEPEAQSFAKLDYDTFEEVLRINTYAPLRLSQAFVDNVAASGQKKIVSITSGLASIESTKRFGGLYFYRVSKTGLNMAMRTLQAEVRSKGIKVGILAPGVVETRLLQQSGFSGPGTLSPEESAASVIRNIEALDDQDANFILNTGETLPW